MNKPIEIFCCAAESDRLFLKRLSDQLAVPEQQGVITLWDESWVPPAAIRDEVIRQHLASARVFLLLISADFLVDDYCKTVMKAALERHKRGNATTIPVIVRPCNWQKVPLLGTIQELPRNSPPISSLPNQEQDEALRKVAEEIVAGLGEPPVGPKGDGSGHKPLSGLVRAAVILMHVLQFLFIRRPGWALIGVLVLLSGVLWGVSSPTAPYMKSEDVTNDYAYTPQSSDIYVYPANNKPILFIAHCNDLSPHIDCTKLQGNLSLDFLAIPDTIGVNATVPSDTPGRDLHFTQAHVIEQLKLYDQSSNPIGSYAASDYNSNGYYESRWWPVAWELMGAGLVIIAAVVLSTRLRWGKRV